MKNIFKYTFLLGVLLSVHTSCDQDFDELNTSKTGALAIDPVYAVPYLHLTDLLRMAAEPSPEAELLPASIHASQSGGQGRGIVQEMAGGDELEVVEVGVEVEEFHGGEEFTLFVEEGAERGRRVARASTLARGLFAASSFHLRPQDDRRQPQEAEEPRHVRDRRGERDHAADALVVDVGIRAFVDPVAARLDAGQQGFGPVEVFEVGHYNFQICPVFSKF